MQLLYTVTRSLILMPRSHFTTKSKEKKFNYCIKKIIALFAKLTDDIKQKYQAKYIMSLDFAVKLDWGTFFAASTLVSLKVVFNRTCFPWGSLFSLMFAAPVNNHMSVKQVLSQCLYLNPRLCYISPEFSRIRCSIQTL